MNPQKSRLLTLLDILITQSDEEHPLTIVQILATLEKQGISANRRTIASDMETLEAHGHDVVKVKSRQNLYYIGDRHFELPELRLLTDAVQSSKFITPSKSRKLADKLYKLLSVHQQADLIGSAYLHNVKPQNESVYLAENSVRTAIHRKRQVTFKYFDYAPDKSKIFKHEGHVYQFSPYRLVWSEDKFYALGYSDKHGKIATFRVDRMSDVKVSRKTAIPPPPDFDIADFCKRTFEMYDGELVEVELECDNDLMKVIIDKFGEEVHTEIISKERFRVRTEVRVSPMFYGWLFQFTARMKLTAPAEVVKEYKKMLKNAM
jgi:predicted DNA-binding transcriptional regulator YafY